MTPAEYDRLAAVVKAGHPIVWHNPTYQVIVGADGKLLIDCPATGGCIGLHPPDYKISDFHHHPKGPTD